MPVYTYTTLDDPSATTMTSAYGVNNAGQIVGSYIDSSNHLHGFLLSGGVYPPLDDPLAGSSGTAANAINASGQIVGRYTDAANHVHGYLLSGGTYTAIDDPLATTVTEASGINAFGQVVGHYVNTTGRLSHGFPLPERS